MGGGIIRQTITDDDLRAIAHDFGVTLNEKFLNSSHSPHFLLHSRTGILSDTAKR